MNNNYNAEDFFFRLPDMDRLYQSLEKADYTILYDILRLQRTKGETEKIYLSELAEFLNLSVTDTSKIVKKLQNRGYVDWSTTENNERTYIKITSYGVELMQDEARRMKKCYEEIKKKISQEDIDNAVGTFKKISAIIKSVQ